MLPSRTDSANQKPHPTSDQPGTLLQQMQAIMYSIYLGDRRKTTARREWGDARALVMPHAREASTIAEPRSCAPHNDPANFVDTADPRRNGWVQTRCRHCGRLIGYRQVTRDRKGGTE